MWRISMRNALESAAIAASLSGVMDPMPAPSPKPRPPLWPGFFMMGNRLGSALDPIRHIVGDAVLPGREPDQNQAYVFLAGILDLRVHQVEVEPAFFRLHQFPVHRSHHRVHVQGLELFPNRLHILEPGGARVVKFSSEHDKRLAVHEHLLHNAVLPDLLQRGMFAWTHAAIKKTIGRKRIFIPFST